MCCTNTEDMLWRHVQVCLFGTQTGKHSSKHPLIYHASMYMNDRMQYLPSDDPHGARCLMEWLRSHDSSGAKGLFE